ncbi:MAG: zinc-binding alcohol dehydrogenase [Vicinamibacterales bacterium]|nr:zinc-binding alcohol dehydrogenase [Vicinamibacterales bacterium]
MSEPIIAQQFWIQSPGHGEIVQATLGAACEGDVLVAARYSGISRGTESLVFRGDVPSSLYADMRAPFQEGEFPGPVKYGYSSVGDVIEGPAEWRGRSVFCLFPHQDRYRVPIAAVTPLPADVPAPRAVLAANMETAVNVAWDAGPSVGDRVVVVGAGVVGLLVAWLFRHMAGIDLTVVDLNPARAEVADALGLSCVTEPPVDTDADLVVHASGQPEGLVMALSVAGVEATIVEASWYGTRQVRLPLGERFHARRLTLRSSQVGRLSPTRVPRWTHGRRLALALDLLRADELDVLISGESRFDELPAVMASLAEEPGDTLCHRIRYG